MPTPARERNPRLSPGLDAVITRLLQTRPEQRFASAREAHDALEALRPAGDRVTFARRPWVRAVFALLGLGAIVWVALRSSPPTTAHPPTVVAVQPFADHSGD